MNAEDHVTLRLGNASSRQTDRIYTDREIGEAILAIFGRTEARITRADVGGKFPMPRSMHFELLNHNYITCEVSNRDSYSKAVTFELTIKGNQARRRTLIQDISVSEIILDDIVANKSGSNDNITSRIRVLTRLVVDYRMSPMGTDYFQFFSNHREAIGSLTEHDIDLIRSIKGSNSFVSEFQLFERKTAEIRSAREIAFSNFLAGGRNSSNSSAPDTIANPD